MSLAEYTVGSVINQGMKQEYVCSLMPQRRNGSSSEASAPCGCQQHLNTTQAKVVDE